MARARPVIGLDHVGRNAIETFGLGSTILCESVPFDLISNRSRAAHRRNFFAEVLPEGTALNNLAAEIRVSTDDTIALLVQFGRDVAGAIQITIPRSWGSRAHQPGPAITLGSGTMRGLPLLRSSGARRCELLQRFFADPIDYRRVRAQGNAVARSIAIKSYRFIGLC